MHALQMLSHYFLHAAETIVINGFKLHAQAFIVGFEQGEGGDVKRHQAMRGIVLHVEFVCSLGAATFDQAARVGGGDGGTRYGHAGLLGVTGRQRRFGWGGECLAVNALPLWQAFSFSEAQAGARLAS